MTKYIMTLTTLLTLVSFDSYCAETEEQGRKANAVPIYTLRNDCTELMDLERTLEGCVGTARADAASKQIYILHSDAPLSIPDETLKALSALGWTIHFLDTTG